MARGVLTLLPMAIGLGLLGWGIFALFQSIGAAVPDLPGSTTYALRDQAIVALMGGGLLLLGALRMSINRSRDE